MGETLRIRVRLRSSGPKPASADQRDGPVVHIRDHAEPIGQEQRPRLRENIALRVVEPEEGLQHRRLVFGDDLTVRIGVEAVDHDPVVARDLTEFARALVAELLKRTRLLHRADHLGDAELQRANDLRWLLHPLLDLDDGVAAVQVGSEAPPAALPIADGPWSIEGDAKGSGAKDFFPANVCEIRCRAGHKRMREEILTPPTHPIRAGPEGEQRSERLGRAGNVDGLQFATAQINR